MEKAPKLTSVERRKAKYPYKYNLEDPSYDPYALRDVKLPLNDLETFVHLLKGLLGGGILAMPYAFSKAGLLFGLGASIALGVLIAYGVHTLIDVSHIIAHRWKIPAMTYPETAELCFRYSANKTARSWDKTIRYIVDALLLMDMLGCCVIYAVFVSENGKQLIEHFTQFTMSLRIWIWVFTIPFMLIVLIRNLKYLVPFSVLANICLAIGLSITIYECVTGLPDIDAREKISAPLEWPIFIGTVFFALECIAIIMSLENDMKYPHHMIGCPSVLNCAVSLTTTLYVMVGFFGYWRYGSEVKGSITLNLNVNDLSGQVVKALVSFAIFCSYPLYYYTPFKIMWHSFSGKIPENKQLICEYCCRIILVLFLALIAFVIPNLGPLISLVGAVCISFLGVIFPMCMELACYNGIPGYGRFNWRLWKCILFILFGVFVLITGCIASVTNIVRDFLSIL